MILFLRLCAMPLFIHTGAVGRLCCQGTAQAYVQLAACHHPRAFPTELLPSPSIFFWRKSLDDDFILGPYLADVYLFHCLGWNRNCHPNICSSWKVNLVPLTLLGWLMSHELLMCINVFRITPGACTWVWRTFDWQIYSVLFSLNIHLLT